MFSYRIFSSLSIAIALNLASMFISRINHSLVVSATQTSSESSGVFDSIITHFSDKELSITISNTIKPFFLNFSIVGTPLLHESLVNYCHENAGLLTEYVYPNLGPNDVINSCVDFFRSQLATPVMSSFKAIHPDIGVKQVDPFGHDIFYYVQSWMSSAILRVNVGKWTYGYHNLALFYFGEPNAGLNIGKYCSIAASVTVFVGGNHRYNSVSTYPMFQLPAYHQLLQSGKLAYDLHLRQFPYSNGPIMIGSDVWIGYGVTIFSGVTIGHGSILGAGAVVRKDVPPYAIVVGDPAIVIKYRHNASVIQRLLRISWWDWDNDKIAEALPFIILDQIDEFLHIYDSDYVSYSDLVLQSADCVPTRNISQLCPGKTT